MEDGLGQVAKLLVARAEVRLTRAFWVGKGRQDRADGCVGEVGLDVTVQEQQTEVKHQNGEGEMERDYMRTQQTPFS